MSYFFAVVRANNNSQTSCAVAAEKNYVCFWPKVENAARSA